MKFTKWSSMISLGDAIRKLKLQEIDVIFTVDLFNEGVDIPSVDTLLIATSTESMVVFTSKLIVVCVNFQVKRRV